MADTKIRFQAEGLDGIHSDMNILIQDARNLSSIFESSSEKVIDGLREQIKLLKERNSLSGQKISPVSSSMPSFSSGSDDLRYSFKDLTSKIDELIEMVKSEGLKLDDTTLEALRGRRPGTAPGQEEEGSVNSLNFWKGYAKSSMFSAINTGFSSFANSISAENPYIFKQQNIQTVGNLIGSLTAPLAVLGPYGLAAAAVGSLIGGGLNLISQANIQGYKEISSSENSRSRLARLLGGNPGDYIKYARDLQGYLYGYENEEALANTANFISAAGTNLDRINLNRLLGSTRAFDISSVDIASLVRSQRGSNQDSVETLGRLFANLQNAGLTSAEASIQMSEYLKLLVQLNQSQLDKLGEINQEGNLDLITRLTSVTGPGQAGRVNRIVQNLDQSISSPNSPQMQAILYQAIKEANPSASYLDVKRIQDEGFSANPEALKSFINIMSRVSGGNYEQTILNMRSFFGGTVQDSEALYKAYLSGGNISDKAKALTSNQIMERGLSQTSVIAQANATEEQAKLLMFGKTVLEEVANSLSVSIQKANLSQSLDLLSSEINSYALAIKKARANLDRQKSNSELIMSYRNAHGSQF